MRFKSYNHHQSNLNALCHGCILTNAKAGIAQLVERNLAKVEVASSNLVSRSSHYKLKVGAVR